MEKSKLTAYALNEVSQSERVEIEKYLDANPDIKREVEETKLISSILKNEMASDLVLPAPALKIKKSKTWGQRLFAYGFSLATVAAVFLLVLVNSKSLNNSMESAVDEITDLQASKQIAKQLPLIKSEERVKTIVSNEAPSEMATMADNVAPIPPPPPHSQAMPVKEMDSMREELRISEQKFDKNEASKIGGLGSNNANHYGALGSGSGAGAVVSNKRMAPSAPAASIVVEAPEAETVSNTEEYKLNPENDFILVAKEALSTFSIDVDTASYTNARRYLMNYNQIPPADSIRTEEFINYFDYDYKAPKSGHPIAVNMEVTQSPWNSERALIRVGLKGKELDMGSRPKSNLVFLIDASGSMEDENKMPLVKSALKTLTEQLDKDDRISMVVYAGQSGVILDSESGRNKDKIIAAIQKLSSGGSTNGEGGIRKAYEIAQKNYISGGNNRVILASDGDFNVGVTSPNELLKIIKEKSEGGVFLTVLGFGMGNYKDARMEEISNKGQGNYFYIDNAKEATKVFVNQLAGTLYTIAKDVKVQVEFNPKLVHSYRLVGYENRMLKKEDFTNDKIDAGEMGAGHSVTALYEIEWKGKRAQEDAGLKYQTAPKIEKVDETFSDEILTAKIRYKKPKNSSSEYFDQVLKNNVVELDKASCATRFAVAVASFSQWMRQSIHLKDFDSAKIVGMAEGCIIQRGKKDEFKSEFLDLVKKARGIRK